jgi:hypothetical protein
MNGTNVAEWIPASMLHQALLRQLVRGNAWLASWEPPVKANRVRGVLPAGVRPRRRGRKKAIKQT